MSKIDVNKKLKENSLLNTAFEFFTTKGFSKTSISDIAGRAGVAKGTFYLYFKDKYDIRNRLISHKSSQLFQAAADDLEHDSATQTLGFEDKIIYIINHIMNQLNQNQELLTFISKNLSWGVFKNALTNPTTAEDINFSDVYHKMLDEAPYQFHDPEIMLFLIVELVSGACYSCILYQDPCTLEELRPHLDTSIRMIIQQHRVTESAS